ncbi:MAG TPA: hypothetical protein VHB47_18435, partial [Thermoanaerobaculia bacterium]|nr:hypothetical protein [Thermoanaerobaculia bacterium]
MPASSSARCVRFSVTAAAAFAAWIGLVPAGPATGATQATTSTSPLLGFSSEHAADERALEARFDAALRREELAPWLKRLSARPHHLGSPYDKENAEFIAGL